MTFAEWIQSLLDNPVLPDEALHTCPFWLKLACNLDTYEEFVEATRSIYDEEGVA